MTVRTKHAGLPIALIGAVIDWANARNLIKGATAKDQSLKLGSEVGEIFEGLEEFNHDKIADGLGDSVVVAIIVSEQIGIPLRDALANAEVIDKLPTRIELNIAKTLGLAQDMVLKGNVEAASKHLAALVISLSDMAHAHLAMSLGDCLQIAYDEIKDRKGVMYRGTFLKESDPMFAEAMADLYQTDAQ